MSLADATTVSPRTRLSLADVIAREDRRHRRRIAGAWIAFAVALLAAAAGYYVLRPKPVPLSARFRVQQVTRGDVVREVHATGHAEALTTVLVGAEISGRIASVDVDFNQYVRTGQVLARFDRAALQAQLAQTQATLAAARTALEQAKAELTQTARARERAVRLNAQGSASEADRDLAEANARVAEQRVRAAEAQIAAQTAQLALAQTNLGHAEIRAPIDGIVITRNIDPGQSVASVLQAPTLFTVAADLRDPRELQSLMQRVTGVLATLLAGVAAISLLVGGIGIMNIMLVSVTERTREIGIRLAVGARASDILLQFLVEAVLLCAAGGTAGIALGLAAARGIAAGIHIPFVVPLSAMPIAFAVSVGIGIAFGVFPARKAARLHPLAALRFE